MNDRFAAMTAALSDVFASARWHVKAWHLVIAGSVVIATTFAFSGADEPTAPDSLVAYQEQLTAGIGDTSVLENVTPPVDSKTTVSSEGELLVATVGAWNGESCWAIRLLVDGAWLEGAAGNSHVSEPFETDPALCPASNA